MRHIQTSRVHTDVFYLILLLQFLLRTITITELTTSDAECIASDIIAYELAIIPASSFKPDKMRLAIMLIFDTRIASFSSIKMSSFPYKCYPIILARISILLGKQVCHPQAYVWYVEDEASDACGAQDADSY